MPYIFSIWLVGCLIGALQTAKCKNSHLLLSEYACVHFPSKFENTSCNIKLIGIGTSLGGRNNKRAFVPLGSLETLSRPPRDVSKAWYDVPLQWKPINTLFVAAEKWDNVRNYLRFLRFVKKAEVKGPRDQQSPAFCFFCRDFRLRRILCQGFSALSINNEPQHDVTSSQTILNKFLSPNFSNTPWNKVNPGRLWSNKDSKFFILHP